MLSDNVIVAIVAGTPGIIAALGTFINIIMHSKTDNKIAQLERSTNGMKDDLIKSTGQLEYRKGEAGSAPGFPEEKI